MTHRWIVRCVNTNAPFDTIHREVVAPTIQEAFTASDNMKDGYQAHGAYSSYTFKDGNSAVSRDEARNEHDFGRGFAKSAPARA